MGGQCPTTPNLSTGLAEIELPGDVIHRQAGAPPRINGMKPAFLCTLLLATAALATSCCSDNDIVTVVADSSAGIHDDLIFPADCRQPQMLVPNGTSTTTVTRTLPNGK